MKDFRVLIISNNCLSKYNSNGRTLLNMLGKLKRENIFQIYTSGEVSDSNYCKKSYCITNKDVILSYFGKKPSNVTREKKEEGTPNNYINQRKNAFTMLLRDIVWDYSFFIKKYTVDWAKKQNPDIVLLHLGDSTLQITLAIKIAKALRIPIVTYNTEDYYFKNYDYMKQSLESGIMYKLFHHRFCRKFRSLMKLSSQCIYNCKGLSELYDNEFSTESKIIYGTTDFKASKLMQSSGEKIVYAGNLGVGRHKGLIEIGKALQKIDTKLILDVYGNASDSVKDELMESVGIRYNGVISYEENCEIIRNSRLLIHVESFDAFYSKDTKYAFSTKIADYCASGVPIFMFSPISCESTGYIKRNEAAFIACGRDELMCTLKEALSNNLERMDKVERAMQLAKRNHQKKINEQSFIDVLNKALES